MNEPSDEHVNAVLDFMSSIGPTIVEEKDNVVIAAHGKYIALGFRDPGRAIWFPDGNVINVGNESNVKSAVKELMKTVQDIIDRGAFPTVIVDSIPPACGGMAGVVVDPACSERPAADLRDQYCVVLTHEKHADNYLAEKIERNQYARRDLFFRPGGEFTLHRWIDHDGNTAISPKMSLISGGKVSGRERGRAKQHYKPRKGW